MTTKTYAVGGDSQSDIAQSYSTDGWDCHGPRVAASLRKAGYDYRARNFGKAGDTTTQLLARLGQLFRYDTPDIVTIYIGVNDPLNSITQATTQLNIQATLLALKHGARGDTENPNVAVATQANLPSSGRLSQRYVVLSDTSTTGGVAAVRTTDGATITGAVAGSGPAVWEYRTSLAGELGWGRVAISTTPPTVVKRIVVVSTNYLNFTTGGDTPSTPYATYAPVRAAQQAAVAAENVPVSGQPSVVYADLYALMRGRIVAGTDPDFSTATYDQTKSWHGIQNNQHHNAYGNDLVHRAVIAAVGTAGWSLT